MGVPVSNADIECKSASPTSVDNEVSPQMPPPNDNPTRCIDAGAMSLVGETPAGKTPTAWSQSPSATSPNSIIDVAGLWDNAYSLLRIRFGRLLNAYETMIDLYLAREGEEDKFERQLSTTDIMEDDFHHSDPSMRQRRMARVINIWLADHGHHKTAISTPEARVEGANRRFRHSLRPSLERTGFISLPWAAACLAVESIFQGNLMSKANRSGLIEIISKMEWYIGLSRLIFQYSDERVDQPATPCFRHQKEKLLELYTAILHFTIEQSLASMSQGSKSEPPGINDSMRQRVFDLEGALVEDLRGSETQSLLGQLLDSAIPETDFVKTDKARAILRERLNDLHITLQPVEAPSFEVNPNNDELLHHLYSWANGTKEYKSLFQQQSDPAENGCSVLWVSGPPGAGKTMLMRATVQGLLEETKAVSSTDEFNLAYFFCDNRNQPRGYATRIIKSLIWQMIESQPYLAEHLKEKSRSTRRYNFNNPSDFYAMSTVLYSMLNEKDSKGGTRFGLTYVIVDSIENLFVENDPGAALDPDLAVRDLLELIITTARISPQIRWLVSVDPSKVGANLTPTDGVTGMRLDIGDEKHTKGLEGFFKDNYIPLKVSEVARSSAFNDLFKNQVTTKLSTIAPHNFLWVDMACRRLEPPYTLQNATRILDKLPRKVNELYQEAYEMLNNLNCEDQDMCRNILQITAVTYQPLHKSEVASLVDLPPHVDLDIVVSKICSSFLELHNDNVCYVHTSARDFVLQSLIDNKAVTSTHLRITQQCLKHVQVKHKTNSNTYAITNWMRHLWPARSENSGRVFQIVNQFFNDYFLEWTDILARERLVSEAVVLLQALNTSFQKTMTSHPPEEQRLFFKNIQQALWLLNFHQSIKSPGDLSPKFSLPFLPGESELRQKLLPKALPWLDIAPDIGPSEAPGMIVHILDGHGEEVRCCCYSPNGRLIASGGNDGAVRLWDSKSFQAQHVFYIGSYVYRVMFISDQYLVTMSSDKILVWDVFTGAHLKSIEPEDCSKDIHLPRDGKALVATRNHAVVLFKVPPDPKNDEWTESTLDSKHDWDFQPKFVRFSPDGALIAYTVHDKIVLFDTKSGIKKRWSLIGHTDSITGLDFCHNSRYLASGSSDTTIRVWDTYDETGQPLDVLRGHEKPVNCISFSPDASRLASGSSNGTIRIWVRKLWANGSDHSPSYKPEKVLYRHSSAVCSLHFNPLGQQLISSSEDTKVLVWDMSPLQDTEDCQDDVEELPGPSPSMRNYTKITFMTFSPDGKFFASASAEGTICLWDCSDGRKICTFTKHYGEITWLEFSRDGTILVSASTDRTACIWDMDEKILKFCLRGHEGDVKCAVISPDGKLVASTSNDRSVRVWNISNLPLAKDEDSEGKKPEHMCFRSVKAYRDKYTGFVYTAAFSPNGSFLASAGNGGTILIWDLTLGDYDQIEPEIVLGNTLDSIRGLAFQDDTRIVSYETSGAVKVWNCKTKSCEKILRPETRAQLFKTIQFSEMSADILITEIGAWSIIVKSPISSTLDSKSDDTTCLADAWLSRETPPDWCPYGISNDRQWITWNNKNKIFLPPQYCPDGTDRVACRVQGNKVVIGSKSGKVLFFKFSETLDPVSEND
ncbi:WD40-repeat-containing domain protein [Nemania diffusa]|nr:WD40-repeat-containing domain protein [Nemania diffusa]